MKSFFFFLLILITSVNAFSQNTNLYNPSSDAKSDIKNIIKKAKAEHKYILLQGGGNWCKWCIEFHRFCKADKQIDSIIDANYIWYHLNYSKENKNEDLFKKYAYPQRFGFPVFIILDENGNRIHTQNSEYLEDGKSSYDKNKIISFLNNWSPSAVDPKNFN